MRLHQQTLRSDVCKSVLAVALIFFFIFMVMNIMPRAEAVKSLTGANASLTLFDDGDRDWELTGTNKSPGLEVNRLFNDTTNVYFYANFTNGTGQSMIPIGGTACAIEFAADAGGNKGPFAMSNNNTLNLLEYNRSFPRNGTFAWNVTCQNTAAGVANITLYDNVRIFGPGCYGPTGSVPNLITNNTILCGSTLNINATASAVFNISNNNVTLDCNGSVIRGNGTGIALEIGPYNGTIIQNCYFENYTNTIVTNPGAFKDYILLFNNSFANSNFGPNLTRLGNITMRANNFTNLSTLALYELNVTNGTILRNRFCQNGLTYNSENANASFTNNTLCVTLTTPANNTNQNEINFTFNVPSFGSLARTCDLVTNSTNALFGRTTVPAGTTLDVNVTVNTTFFSNDRINWQVNCTDTNDNGGISTTFNTTYKACTLPTVGFEVSNANITLCPGRYNLNTPQTGFFINGTAGGVVCNNTIISGNNGGTAVKFLSPASDGQLRNCYIANFGQGINADRSGPDRLFIYNNTLQNITTEGFIARNISGMNMTNNTFSSVGIGISLLNSFGHSIDNNIIYNATNSLLLDNATGVNLRNNNISNISGTSIQMNVSDPLENMTLFNYTISGNYFCGNRQLVFLIQNFGVSTTLNGTVSANTFCNSTDSVPNGGIANVSWTADVLVWAGIAPLIGSLISTNIVGTTIADQQGATDSTGIARLYLQQFNISTDNVVTERTPHRVLANQSSNTKAVIVNMTQTRISRDNNMVIINFTGSSIGGHKGSSSADSGSPSGPGGGGPG
ncbi:right-handed parallel beta-helix repeat-containing protein, partial [Candidatus Woesearchaeota archaeon]|nr:right-handed parallel beta-helix repeat-containing protein [Candidatus Woesearchaeota archaeon]